MNRRKLFNEEAVLNELAYQIVDTLAEHGILIWEADSVFAKVKEIISFNPVPPNDRTNCSR